ncbi:MAG TPA: hypothetical protein VFL87_01510, partial [Thermoleophilaceae bacterium]|nr:hypothetical protein [Thermoleophilaceae bacterium]
MPRRRLAGVIGTTLVVLSLSVAACGGGGSGKSSSEGPSTAQAAQTSGNATLQSKMVSVIRAMEPRVVQIENSRGL